MRWVRVSVGFAAITLALALTRCVTSPRSHTGVNVASGAVTFTGVAQSGAGASVVVQVRDPAGAWVSVGSAPVGARDTWTVEAQVPDADWSTPCGVAVFQVLYQRQGGAQDASIAGLDGPCVADAGPPPPAGADPTAYFQALSACTTTTFTVHRSGAPVSGATYVGNLDIVGQAQADLYQCVSTVQGDLTLTGDDTLPSNLPDAGHGPFDNTLSLPNLAQVTGNVTATLGIFEVSDPQRMTVVFVKNALDTPSLASIGGTLTLVTDDHALNPIDERAEYHFGMDALTSVQNLAFTQPFENEYPGGLGALTTIPGNVDITWIEGETHLGQQGAPPGSLGDYDGEDFLTNLTSIGGNFHYTSRGGNLVELFPKLVSVGGDLSFTALGGTYQPGLILTHLSQVGGVFTVNASYCQQVPQFRSLAQVGGLALTGGDFGSPIGSGSLGIGANGITFDASANTGFPFPITPTLAPAAPVTMTNNASLCECQIAAFVQALRSQGWNGTLVDTGNAGTLADAGTQACTTTSGTCPAPSCGSPGGGTGSQVLSAP